MEKMTSVILVKRLNHDVFKDLLYGGEKIVSITSCYDNEIC